MSRPEFEAAKQELLGARTEGAAEEDAEAQALRAWEAVQAHRRSKASGRSGRRWITIPGDGLDAWD